MKDEVLEELWAIKDEIAREHGHDLDALVAHLRKSPDPREQQTVLDIGTIEGYFVAIDLQNGQQTRLSDALTGESIPCDVEEEKLDDIWHWMRHRVRVGVTGPISYDGDGKALRLEAQRLRPIDAQRAVDVEDVLGIFNRAGYVEQPD